ncbi:M56 family metallopeptidase [Alteromonas sp. A079]|uniref:M56 family metallopeptidase n=1 Tax=Alteromonas sp. A079 TaxID=3410268 RepID=UPI003B9E87D2
MINWIFSQQITLSITLLILIAFERFLTAFIGPRLSYKLWFFVPLTIAAFNLPIEIAPAVSGQISRYVVGIAPALPVTNINAFYLVWAAGAVLVSTYITAHYIAIYASIGKRVNAYKATYYSQRATTPMLYGFITPKILLPLHFTSFYNHQQQRMIIEHEIIHARQGDHIWNGIALLITTACWFNPIVWLALKSFRIHQELACDSRVLHNKSNDERLSYAKALVQCAEHSSATLNLYPTFGEKSTMIKRLQHIKQPQVTSKLISIASVLIISAFTANIALANLSNAPVEASKINDAKPVKRVEPLYPQNAVTNELEGSVVLQFDITETGTTDNISIVNSTPEGVFDESARYALSQWEYKPRIQGGKAQRQAGLLVQLDYKLRPETAAQ